MIQSIHNDLLYLSNTFSKLLKRSFGKGPESCHAYLNENRLYIYIRNFITQGEEILLKYDDMNLAMNFRAGVIDGITEEILRTGTQVLGYPLNTLYHDWNYDSNMGMLMLVGDTADRDGQTAADGNKELFELILKISSQIHKIPNDLKVIKFTQNMCVIEAKGVTLKLESFLYERGDLNILHKWQREIKKGYMVHKERFEGVFERFVDEIFLMWDYTKDQCYLIFNFNRGQFNNKQ